MSREQWRRLVIEWMASGMSSSEFCKPRGLNHKLLGWWKWKLTSDNEDLDPKLPVPFVEVAVTSSGTQAAPRERIELDFADVHMSIPDDFAADTLARVFAVLEARQ